MYYYFPFSTIDINKKQVYLDLYITTEHYLFREDDVVKNKFAETIENKKRDISILDKFDGYLIYDELGLKQIEYLTRFLAWEYVDEISTSIFEKLAKQIIYFNREVIYESNSIFNINFS